MEDEARDILRSALSHKPMQRGGLAAFLRAHFAAPGGVAMPTIVREPMRAPPSLDE